MINSDVYHWNKMHYSTCRYPSTKKCRVPSKLRGHSKWKFLQFVRISKA